MKEKTFCFVEKISGITFIVNVKPAEKAKHTTDEFIKELITKECLTLEADCAKCLIFFQDSHYKIYKKCIETT